ncbi:MAG: glycosyltransferase family 2 protein [Methanosarcinaceae archaeon]
MDDSQVVVELMHDVSVVIPTKNRVRECEALFTGLQVAVENAGGCEVIVVDDSDPGDAIRIKQLCNLYGYRFISSQTPSVAAKRNHGWMAAKGDVVLFLDSDCLPEKDLIVEHLKAYSQNGSTGCLGDLSFVGPENLFFKATKFTPFFRPFQFARRFAHTSWGPTANISFRKSELERVGGFDTTFPDRPGGEDVDLGLRITAKNHPIRCNAAARVGHSTSTWNTYKGNLKRFFGWGRADYYLIVKHLHRTTIDLPRIPLTFGFLLALSILLSAVKMTFHFLSLPLVWLGLTIGFATILFYCENGKPTLLERFIALTYILANEIGTLWEGLLNRYLPIIFRRMNYGDGQIYGEWHEAGRRLWAQWLALIVCFWLY